MPLVLDNAIKEDQEAFFTEMGKLTAEDILAAIRIVHPKCYTKFPQFPGISQYPINDILARGECMLSTQGWMALAVTCYNRNPQTLSFLSVLMQPKYMDENLAPHDELSGWSKLVAGGR